VFLSLSLFFLWSPLCLIYLFCLAHFVDAVTYEKQLLYFHIVDILHHIYITFIYNIILFLSILFSSNALFTYTGKNVLLKFGILCSLFFGLDKHLRYFECPVALWSVITEAHPCLQYQGCYLLLTANNSPNWHQINQTRCGKKTKIQLCLLCCGRCRHSLLNLKYFIQAVKFLCPTQNLLWPPKFPSLSCGPIGT